MVPRAGIEPALPREQDFKSCVSTNSTIWAKRPVTRSFLDDSLFLEGSESSSRNFDAVHQTSFRIFYISIEEIGIILSSSSSHRVASRITNAGSSAGDFTYARHILIVRDKNYNDLISIPTPFGT